MSETFKKIMIVIVCVIIIIGLYYFRENTDCSKIIKDPFYPNIYGKIFSIMLYIISSKLLRIFSLLKLFS